MSTRIDQLIIELFDKGSFSLFITSWNSKPNYSDHWSKKQVIQENETPPAENVQFSLLAYSNLDFPGALYHHLLD